MQVEIHAMRFADDDQERDAQAANHLPFNSQPAKLKIEKGQEVVITAKDGVAHITIDGKPQGWAVSLAEWDYTAVAITY